MELYASQNRLETCTPSIPHPYPFPDPSYVFPFIPVSHWHCTLSCTPLWTPPHLSLMRWGFLVCHKAQDHSFQMSLFQDESKRCFNVSLSTSFTNVSFMGYVAGEYIERPVRETHSYKQEPKVLLKVCPQESSKIIHLMDWDELSLTLFCNM